MRRFETRIENGHYEIEGPEGWLEIGSVADIVDTLGDPYVIEYTDEEAAVPWLDTDDGVLRIDVEERLPTLSFDEEFVTHIEETPVDHRLAVFIDLIDRIWSAKGNLNDY